MYCMFESSYIFLRKCDLYWFDFLQRSCCYLVKISLVTKWVYIQDNSEVWGKFFFPPDFSCYIMFKHYSFTARKLFLSWIIIFVFVFLTMWWCFSCLCLYVCLKIASQAANNSSVTSGHLQPTSFTFVQEKMRASGHIYFQCWHLQWITALFQISAYALMSLLTTLEWPQLNQGLSSGLSNLKMALCLRI